jgi:hypothetical protein
MVDIRDFFGTPKGVKVSANLLHYDFGVLTRIENQGDRWA